MVSKGLRRVIAHAQAEPAEPVMCGRDAVIRYLLSTYLIMNSKKSMSPPPVVSK